MGSIKEINIRKGTYYFYNDMIDIKNFGPNLLKMDKKSYKNNDVYYIGYLTIKNIGNYRSIHCVNPSYFVIGEVYEYI